MVENYFMRYDKYFSCSSIYIFGYIYAAFPAQYRRRFCVKDKQIMQHNQDNGRKIDSGCYYFKVSIPLVQNSTSVLYFLYMAYVLKVQSLCTNATTPMYKQYRGFVQKTYRYNRVISLFATV